MTRGRRDSAYAERRTDQLDDTILDPFKRDAGVTDRKTWGAGSASIDQIRVALGGTEKLTRPYIQNPWVYACVRAKAKAVASVPLRFRRDEDPDSEPITEGELFQLFRKPAPMFSQRKFLYLHSVYHDLFGEVFWFMLGQGGESAWVEAVGRSEGMSAEIRMPSELWPIRGDVVELVLDEKTNMPKSWKYSGAGGKIVEAPAHAVVQINELDPYNIMRGLGPTTPAMRTIQKDYQAERYDEGLLANGGTPQVAITVNGQLSDGQKKSARSQWRERHGGPENQGMPLLLEGGAKADILGFSPADMQFSDMRNWDRETVMAIYGVTKPVLGITEDVNRANAREAIRVFWENTIVPYLDLARDEIQTKFVDRVQTPGLPNGAYAYFDLSQVEALKEEESDRLERMLSLFERGAFSKGESASVAGVTLPENTQGLEERFIDSSKVPVEMAGQQFARDGDTTASSGKSELQDGDLALDQKEEPVPDDGITQEYADAVIDAVYAVTQKHEDALFRVVNRELKRFYNSSLRRIERFATGKTKKSALSFKSTQSDVRDLVEIGKQKWIEEFSEAIEKPFGAIWTASAKDMAKSLGSPGFVSVENPEAAKWLSKVRFRYASDITETSINKIREAVLKNIVGETSGRHPLRKRIEAVLNEVRGDLKHLATNTAGRAQMIARSQTTAVQSRARLTEMREAKVEKHRWLTSRDDHVRQNHSRLHRQVRDVGKEFAHGLKYPGDPSAPPGETCNCRCATAPVVNAK